MIKESTSVGSAIQASVNDPSSPDAVFIPFNKSNQKTKLQKRNYKMNDLLKSIRYGGIKDVMSSIKEAISESCDVDKALKRKKMLSECKKNKEEFKRLMQEKLNGKETSEEGKEPPKKLSLKEKLALKKKKPFSEGKKETCPECGQEKCICEKKEKCECCGKEDCICETVNDKKCCPECALTEKKKARINEGVKRLIVKKKLNEAKQRIAEKRHEKALNESSDFKKELEIMKAARRNKQGKVMAERKELSESLGQNYFFNCDDVAVGIVYEKAGLDDKSNNEVKKYAEEVSMKIEDVDEDHMIFGLRISENETKSIEVLRQEIDKVSAGLFEIFKQYNIGSLGISPMIVPLID